MASRSKIVHTNGVNGAKSLGISNSPGKDRHAQQVSPDRHPATASINGVKGIEYHTPYPSPGKERHERQVSPDRYPATVRTKRKVCLGTWNVRTLNKCGQLQNVKDEMSRLAINILGVCETRWRNNGDFITENHRIIYSGGERNEKGVGLILDRHHMRCVLGYCQLSERILIVKLRGTPFNIAIIVVYAPTAQSNDEEIDTFYTTLDNARAQLKSQEIIIVMGDLNAKVGSDTAGETTGKYGLGTRNERGEKWVQWCTANDQIITNTWFQEHPRRLWTWRSPGGEIKNQIDYITINRRFRNAITHCKTYPSADCGSDHRPVICKLQVRLKKLKKPNTMPKLQYNRLLTDPDLKEKYMNSVKSCYEEQNRTGNTKWDALKRALVTAAMDIIPKENDPKRKNEWITEEILEMMQRRRETKPRHGTEYRTLHKEIRTKCRKAKEEWLNKKCKEVERLSATNKGDMHKQIRELTGQRMCSSTGCIRSKEGTIILEKEKILQRWKEYIGELFHDKREQPAVNRIDDGPEILKSEVEAALAKLKRNKAPGPDGIVAEMMTALDDFGIEKLTEITNGIYNSGEIPEDLSRSIFIALPKKPGANECELHRTISLMSHMTKLIIRILMNRARSRIRPEIGQEQCGFVKDTGTRNAIFMLRILSERAIQVQKKLYLCFIDYAKAFDKVRHKGLFELLSSLDIFGKDIRVLKNLYWQQTACIRVENECSEYTKIERGVRQGCVFSPDLFNLYSEAILRELEDLPGFIIGGHNLNNIRYADDTVLIADTEKKLQELLQKVAKESAGKGLSINYKKTECMVISKKTNQKCTLQVGNTRIKQVQKFKYLGSVLTEDGKCDAEIKTRIGLARNAFQKLSKILKDRKVSRTTKKRVLNCYVIPVLLYGSESWTISSRMRRRLEATEMWFYRRMLRISWTQHVSNYEVLRRMQTKRRLMLDIRKRQLKFLGHVMRKEGLENLILTGRIEGGRDRGKQRTTYLKGLSEWMMGRGMGDTGSQALLRASRDRGKWKAMIAYVLKGYGT
ncbi:reverse transcriptase domain-containing protein [Soonwooa purpurea]